MFFAFLCAFGVVGFTLFILVSLIWLLACVMMFSVIASKKLDKYMVLLENCEARAYADELEKLLPKAKDDVTKNLLNLNLSAAYSDIGRDDFMAHYIFSVKLTEKTHISYQYIYHGNLMSHYVNIGESELAQKELLEAEKLLASPKLKGKLKVKFAENFALKKAELEIIRGNFDGSEELFIKKYDTSKSLREKVYAKCILGKIYEHYGRIDEARECYKFAADNGKDIRCAAESRARLEKIG